VDQLLVIRRRISGVPWKLYNGSYSDYLEAVAKEKAAMAGQKEADRKEKSAATRRRETRPGKPKPPPPSRKPRWRPSWPS